MVNVIFLVIGVNEVVELLQKTQNYQIYININLTAYLTMNLYLKKMLLEEQLEFQEY